ncbi:MAG TPA: hypothetical protein VG938_09400 [Verrucomicrobiae bacterium]|jgi:hypothetical protein|nr:hypothetical protein [Verrucomicrobiae bacterium]
MKSKFILFLALVLCGGLFGCSTEALNPPAGLPLRYHDSQYDLTFSLPASWKGYSILKQQWTGEAYSPEKDTDVVRGRGPIIIFRNPQWKTNDRYQDIPIYIFTRQQWDDSHLRYDAVGAGGIILELWHDDKYVFGMHSRYNTDDSVKGWKEAEEIVRQNCAAHPGPHLHDN